MRDLRFRAYSKKLGMSRPADFAELLGEPRTDFYEFDVYMQYTGLTDRNGVEIYEGDIVDVITTHHDLGVGVIQWVVRDVRFCVKMQTNGNKYVIDGGLDELEVIGNIYENPELLEAQTL